MHAITVDAKFDGEPLGPAEDEGVGDDVGRSEGLTLGIGFGPGAFIGASVNKIIG